MGWVDVLAAARAAPWITREVDQHRSFKLWEPWLDGDFT